MATQIKTETEFKTSDLNVAAYLISQDCTILKVAKSGDRAFFYFVNANRCETLAREYFNGRGQVIPRDFADNIRRAKDLLFSELRR